MTTRRLLALAACACGAALLAACGAMDPAVRQPSVQPPANWRADAPAVATASGALDRDWWRRFGDPALDALLADVRRHNTDIQLARSHIAEYEARLVIARGAQMPSLTASAGPVRARARTPSGAIATATVYQAGVQASYEVDLWGRVAALVGGARADLQAQRAAGDAVALSVTATAASGYVNLLGLDEQLALAQATLESRRASLARAKRLFDSGYSSQLDWAQAQSEYRTATAAVPPLQRAIAQQENALSVLAGRNPGPVARGARPLADWPVGLPSAGLPSQLLRRRPDIAQAEWRLVSADRSLEAARDQLLPSLQLTSALTLQGLTTHQLFDAPTTLWSIGASVLAPLLQRERLHAGVDVGAAQREQALLGYEQAVRSAFADVENALAALSALQAQDAEAAARADAAAEVLRIAHSRYASGYSSYLEELDAQRSLFAAQVAALQVRTALRVAQVDLYRALGGGWSAEVSGASPDRAPG